VTLASRVERDVEEKDPKALACLRRREAQEFDSRAAAWERSEELGTLRPTRIGAHFTWTDGHAATFAGQVVLTKE
jgi:hypothetical protein